MLIKVKKEVEEEITIELPFACKTDDGVVICTEQAVTKARESIIVRYKKGASFYEQEVSDSLEFERIPMEEAVEFLNNVSKSLISAVTNLEPIAA